MKPLRYPELNAILEPLIPDGKQGWVGRQCGVSQATVSQWRSGRERPDPEIPERIVRLAKAVGEDVMGLAWAAGYNEEEIERLIRYLYPSPLTDQDLIEAREDREDFHHSRIEGGDPERLIARGEALASRYEKKLQIADDTPLTRKLRRELGLIFFDLACVHGETKPKDVVLEATGPLAKRMRIHCGDVRLIRGLWRWVLGDGNLIRGRPLRADYYLSDAVEDIDEPDYRLYALRSWGLALANLEEVKRVIATKDEIKALIESGDWKRAEAACQAYEGAALAMAEVKIPGHEPFDLTKKGWDILATIKKAPFRVGQHSRTDLRIALKTEPDDMNLLIKHAKKALHLTEANVRVHEQLGHSLGRELNKAPPQNSPNQGPKRR